MKALCFVVLYCPFEFNLQCLLDFRFMETDEGRPLCGDFNHLCFCSCLRRQSHPDYSLGDDKDTPVCSYSRALPARSALQPWRSLFPEFLALALACWWPVHCCIVDKSIFILKLKVCGWEISIKLAKLSMECPPDFGSPSHFKELNIQSASQL